MSYVELRNKAMACKASLHGTIYWDIIHAQENNVTLDLGTKNFKKLAPEEELEAAAKLVEHHKVYAQMQEVKETLRNTVFWSVIEPLPVLHPTPPPQLTAITHNKRHRPETTAIVAEPAKKKQRMDDDDMPTMTTASGEETAIDAIDALKSFIREECILDRASITSMSNLRLAFSLWSKSDETMGIIAFSKWFTKASKKGELPVVVSKHLKSNILVHGIALKKKPSMNPRDHRCDYRQTPTHPKCGAQAAYKSTNGARAFFCEAHRCKACFPHKQNMVAQWHDRCVRCVKTTSWENRD